MTEVRTKPSRRWGVATAIKAIVAVSLLALLVASGRLDAGEILSTLTSPLHLVGVATLAVSMLGQAVRWWVLLRLKGVNLTLSRAVALSWISQFSALFLPGAMGAEAVRAYYVAIDSPAPVKAAGMFTVVVDRFLGLYAFLWLAIPPLVVLAAGDLRGLVVTRFGAVIGGLVVAMSAILVLARFERVRAAVAAVVPARARPTAVHALEAFDLPPRVLAVTIVLSVVSGIAATLAFVAASWLVGGDDWRKVFVATPLITIANALPISPGGIGVGEAAASFLFTQLDVASGAAIMVLVRIWIVLVRLPGGLFYVLHRRPAATS